MKGKDLLSQGLILSKGHLHLLRRFFCRPAQMENKLLDVWPHLKIQKKMSQKKETAIKYMIFGSHTW